MDNLRLILIISLVFILLMMYQAWQEDYGPKPPIHTTTKTPPPIRSTEKPDTSLPSSPDSELPNTQEAQVGPIELPTAQVKRVLPTESIIQVESDVL